MGDDITIGVTEIVNNIEVTAQPNDQIVDISVIDNADDVTLNITPTVIEINVNKGSSYAKWGTILGTLSDQTDLQNALDLKANLVGGKVPASELPSYVDDVVEVANYAALPTTGETSKIYVTLDNNKIYRWSGSVYIEIAANSAIWGAITGTLSSQTDLQSALDAKFDDPTGDTTQYIAGDGSLITFPIAGQSGTLVRQVRNTTGATLLKGTIVYINGANGNKPTVAKAIATGDSTSAQTFGMLQADISDNANGYVVCVGDIIGLDTSAITEGTQLYLSSTTAGAYTTTKQVAPAHLVYIGVVTRSHPTLGQIEVKIQNGYELDEIHDVLITSKANNQFLVYESATDLWKNKSLGTVLAGTSSQFVKGDGSLDSNTYALDNAVVHLTGAETITGEKSFNNATSSSSIFVTNSSTGNGISSFNTSTGNALYLNNNSTGKGAYINNVSSGIGLFVNNTTAATGLPFVIAKSNSNVFTVNDAGEATGTKFVKSGGTSSQFLKADGSVDTNSYILSVAANAPLGSTGGTSPVISITQATTSSNGYLSSTDWNTFNNKVPTTRTLTINGTAYDLTADRSWTINALPSMLEYNDTDKTIWNNGKNNIGTNTSFGDAALKTNTSGAYNTAFGVSALNLNTTGSANTAVSTYTLSNNTSGYNNTGIGYESLLTNTTGYDNTGVGADALVNNLGGNSNSAVGYGALSSNTSGISNSSIGKYALGSNTTGNYNVGVGDNAGNATLGGGTLNTTSSQSTYIGAFASCSANGVTNEIAIGYASSGNGSNSVTLGNTSITKTILRGSVGIGTTSPSEKLDISGNLRLSDTAPYLTLKPSGWIGSAYIQAGINLAQSAAGDYFSFQNLAGKGFAFQRGTTTDMLINSSGNVGIGTTSPSAKLSITGGSTSTSISNVATTLTSVFNTANPAISLGIGYVSSDIPMIQSFNNSSNTQSNLTINPFGGNVGIGTTSPSEKLHVSGGNIIVDSGSAIGWGDRTAQIVGNTGASGFLRFDTNNAEKMRITSGGDVCINRTSSLLSSKFSIDQSGNGNTNIALNHFYSGNKYVDFGWYGSSIGNISNVGGSAVAYNTTSDYRLKEDFKDYSGLSLVSQIKTYDYKWKSSEDRMYGVKAHELQEVVPYAVTGEKDGENMQGVDYSKLVPILVQAIQELKAEIEILKNK